MSEKLNELSDKVGGFSVAKLATDESFVTAYIQATRLAISEHRTEKLEALRNAVLNSALPSAPDDDQLAIFLNYIERLTPWHLRLLDYFGSDYPYGEYLTLHIPALGGREAFYGLLINDLISCGLLFEDVDELAQTGFDDEFEEDDEQGLRVRKEYASGKRKPTRAIRNERIRLRVSRAKITELGRSFLLFITSPMPK